MKAILLLMLTLSVCLISCEKEEGDLSGQERVRGRLYLEDPLIQDGTPNVLANKNVTISYADSDDTLNYLLATSTDSQGYFTFPHLKAQTRYRLHYDEKINDVLYKAKRTIELPRDSTIVLTASLAVSEQRGLHLIITDSTGSLISGAKVCVFNNQLQATNGNCVNSYFQTKSDPVGRVYKLGIPPGQYFVNAEVTIDSVLYVAKEAVVVGNQLKFDTLQLTRKFVQPVGFQYTVTDSTGSFVDNATLCIFTSRVLFGKGGSCSGSSYKISSDEKGLARKYELAPGKYFVYGYAEADSLKLENIDSVVVEPGMVSYKNIILK